MGVVGCYMGDMYIPEKQREKFAGQVIKLLNYGGMMQLEEISMYGHEMALLKPIHIYPGGNVSSIIIILRMMNGKRLSLGLKMPFFSRIG